MKRMHIHVRVEDLTASTRFYEAVFGQGPTVQKPDYAKWRLEEPAVNFAISLADGRKTGIDHLGIQADTAEELRGLHDGLKAAQVSTFDEEGANCCYAHSNKHWASDPSGVVWEMFQTMGEIATYGGDRRPAEEAVSGSTASGCCAG